MRMECEWNVNGMRMEYERSNDVPSTPARPRDGNGPRHVPTADSLTLEVLATDLEPTEMRCQSTHADECSH